MRWRVVLLCGAAMAAPAYGQDTQSAPEQVDSEGETIVVTGKFQNSLVNRLPIDPKDLPFSVDLIDDAKIEERGFLNAYDILQTLPNVVRRQGQSLPSGDTYLIRGLTATTLTNNRPESLSRGAGKRDMSFIERIEVAKGPTSILLGPVIPGGVVNLVTKSPQQDSFLNATVRGGSFDFYRAELDGNVGRLFGTEALRARMTVAYEHAGSPQKPENAETVAVRPVVEADLGEKTRVQLSTAYIRRTGTQQSFFPSNADGTTPPQITPSTYLGVPSDRTGEDYYVDGEFQHDFLDNLKLVLRGSYQDTSFTYFNSQGGNNYTGDARGFEPGDSLAFIYQSRGSADERVTYGDAQLVGNFSAFGQTQDWVVGGTYQVTDADYKFAFGGVLGAVDIDDIDNSALPAPDFNLPLLPYYALKTELYSAYAETNLRPTDRLTIVAGVRYDKVTSTLYFGGSSDVQETDNVSFRVGGSYELNAGLNAYASYAESFIPQDGLTRAGVLIRPETATNYEVGFKGSLLDERVRLTAAAFWLTRANVATTDPDNGPGESFVAPIGQQVHKGIELSASVDVTRSFKVDLAYGYVDAKITRDNDGQQGNRVTLVPHNNFSVWGNYTVPSGPIANLKLGAGVRGISTRPSPQFNVTYPGYTVVDASIAYPLSERFDVQLNVLNLLDRRYRDSVGFGNGNPAAGHKFGNPRGAYLTLRAKL